MGTWLNKDNLFLQFGTAKATSESAGEFKSYGASRIVEVLIDLTTLTSTAAIQSNTLLFGPGANSTNTFFIEKVELSVETASASGTSFSVGLIQLDRATIPTNYSTAFVNALINASTNAAGDLIVLSAGSTSAGGLIGSSPSATTGPYYITALSSGTYTTGLVRVRIYYRGIGTITQ
jgi:hypothetical protein